MTHRLLPALFYLSFGLVAAEKPAVVPLKVGDTLPLLEGEALSGKRVQLPAATGHHAAVICLGFSENSRHAVEKWDIRFRKDFKPSETPLLYTVPVIEGAMGRFAKPFIISGMRKGTPQDVQDLTVVAFYSDNDWHQRMQVKDENQAYVVLIDGQGRVVWLYSQPYGEDAYEAMKAEIARLQR
jgi:hypothetical protein